jgi:hypothetical protein
MEQNNARIIFRPHARDRAAECCTDPTALCDVLRRWIADLVPDLQVFIGIGDGKGKVGLRPRSGPSPVVRVLEEIIEVVTILRPGQKIIRPDTIELWVAKPIPVEGLVFASVLVEVQWATR